MSYCARNKRHHIVLETSDIILCVKQATSYCAGNQRRHIVLETSDVILC